MRKFLKYTGLLFAIMYFVEFILYTMNKYTPTPTAIGANMIIAFLSFSEMFINYSDNK